MIQRTHFDLLLIDLDLPRNDGVLMCAEVRHFSDDLVIIFLDGNDRVQRHVLGFEVGADDVMRLPYEPEELMARVEVRRRQRYELPLMFMSGVTNTL